jgi:hypothetical protein
MTTTTQDPTMMICYKENLHNLEKFSGDETKKISQFIKSLERIGKMIEANDDILYCMCTAKLDGEARRWYEDNISLTQWQDLKPALLERFEPAESSSKIFERLKERKQKSDETITSYYDAIIKLCREYDPSMSQKMMVSWLENGIKDSLKIQIKRQMKVLAESARTVQAFLKIAKDEQELQEEGCPEPEPIQPYLPYFTNTVSATLQQANNHSQNTTSSGFSYSSPENLTHRSNNQYSQLQHSSKPQPSTQKNRYSTFQQYSSSSQQQPFSSYTNRQQAKSKNNISFNASNQHMRQYNPCSICQRTNHRTIDCYYKKVNGCYKCGQSDHQVRDCQEVFH